jgi:putative lipoic acid-binding regulatory protein
MDKPIIDYPCDWTFKIIGQEDNLLRKAALSTLQERSHTLSNSNTSSGGKYTSLNLVVNVKDATDRDEIFNRLQNNSAIKLIL